MVKRETTVNTKYNTKNIKSETFTKLRRNCHSEQREESQYIECVLFMDSSLRSE